MKRMGSQIQDAEDEEYHELQYHIEVSSSWDDCEYSGNCSYDAAYFTRDTL